MGKPARLVLGEMLGRTRALQTENFDIFFVRAQAVLWALHDSGRCDVKWGMGS